MSLILRLDRYLLQFLVFKKGIYLVDNFYLFLDYDSRKKGKRGATKWLYAQYCNHRQQPSLRTEIFFKHFFNDKFYSHF